MSNKMSDAHQASRNEELRRMFDNVSSTQIKELYHTALRKNDSCVEITVMAKGLRKSNSVMEKFSARVAEVFPHHGVSFDERSGCTNVRFWLKPGFVPRVGHALKNFGGM